MESIFRYKLDHVLFWLLTVGFYAYTRFPPSNGELSGFVFDVVLRNALLAAVIYINLFMVLPAVVRRKQYMMPLLLAVLSVVGYAIIKSLADVAIVNSATPDHTLLSFLFYNLSIVTFYLIFAITLQLSKEWHQQRELLQKIEVEKLNTELEYLKAQINPHFLFNALNTVYFQIDRQNIQARETLSIFSEMLRYQLYECNQPVIPIEKEIRYLKNYVDLQRLRANGNYQIEFQIPDDLANFSIPPLLIIPFVENAFKHISHFQDKVNRVLVQATRENDQFMLNLENTKDRVSQTAGGIGLKNVMRRLELLYANQYSLLIDDNHSTYHVKLQFPVTRV